MVHLSVTDDFLSMLDGDDDRLSDGEAIGGGVIAAQTIKTAGDLVGKVLELVGRTIEAIGTSATAIDPIQFGFIVGTALVALTYFDTTEPYATILRKLKLHGLINQIHAPGTSGNQLQKFTDAVNACITSHNNAGVSIPDALANLAAANTFLGVGTYMEQLIPGLGILDSFLTGVYNRFGIKTPQQLLADTIPQLSAWCAQDIANRRRKPAPPPNAPSNVTCVFSWRYTNLDFYLGRSTKTFTDVDTAIRSWDAANLIGQAGNLLEVTTCDAPSVPAYGGTGPPQPAFHSETTRVIKQSTLHSDIN